MSNNFFDNRYINITLPITQEFANAINQTKFAYILDDLKNADKKYPNNRCVWCDLCIAFDVVTKEIFFSLNTIVTVEGKPEDIITVDDIPFPAEAAEIVRDELLRTLAESLGDMAKCEIHR